jgi:hypothetical protein
MILLGLLLVVEGLSTGLWIARIVPMLSYLNALIIALAILRGLTGAMQTVGGFSLLAGRRHTIGLCQVSLIASAMLTTLEIGARIAPSNLDPTWRWPLTGAYWVYAIGASAWLGREVPVDKNPEVPVEKSVEVPVDKNGEVPEQKNSEVDREPDRRGGDSDPGLFD